jgi:uncharacterized YigZ family protein
MNDDPDRYLTVEDGPRIETKVKGSRFLAEVHAASAEASARARLEAIRKELHNATHHCWAYRVGDPTTCEERSDDDGEPSGTAGTPILGALHRADVFDALVVVTRYFGGTKLGTGGLARAYGDAARDAVEAAPRRPRWRSVILRAACSFDDVGVVETILGKSADSLLEVVREFEPQPRFVLRVKQSQANALTSRLMEATSGRMLVDR